MSPNFKNLWSNMFPSKKEKTQKSNGLKMAEGMICHPLSFPSPSLSPSSISDDGRRSNYSGEIERVFRFIDENGDGKISPSELRRCVKAVGAQRLSAAEAAAAVESSDSDGDGFLNLADFERLMVGDGVSDEEKTAELMEAFVMYSEGKMSRSRSRSRSRSGSGSGSGFGSGCITPKSLKKMMSRLGESKSINDCKAMISVYDANGDGVLSFDEFAAMMR